MPANSIKHYSLHTHALVLMAILHAGFTALCAITRLYTYKTSLLDLGTFDQVLWNLTTHGVALSTTNPPWTAINWFGFHFSPILLLLVPFYTLWPAPELLQMVQSLCFATSGIFVFHAIRALGGRPYEAWVGALFYWLNPFVLSAAIWDFHEIAFATLFMSIALWALCAERFRTMLLALLLLLLTKEHYGLSVAGFGLLWALRTRDWKRGLMVMAFGLVFLVVIVKCVMPATLGASVITDRYQWLEGTTGAKLAMLQHLLFEQSDANIPGLTYLIALLASVCLLPLCAPLYLLPASADLAANLLSSYNLPRHIISYHSAAIVPVLVIAAYQGYARLARKPGIPYKITLYMTALGVTWIVMCVSLLPLALRYWELSKIEVLMNRDPIRHIEPLLPPGPISVQSNLGAFFSHTEHIYPFPHITQETNAVILHIDYPFTQSREHFNIPYESTNVAYAAALRAMLARPGWHVAYWQNPWLLMLRGKATTDESRVRADILAKVSSLEKKLKAPAALQNP